MMRIFADSVYGIAAANPKNKWHAKLVTVIRSLGRARTVTTDKLLDEFLTHFGGHGSADGGRAARRLAICRRSRGT